jgi:hypothetical protein
MASTTGIEFGPNTCLLTAVRTVPRGPGAQICALARIDAREWPHDRSTLTETLRTIRREHGFPRRASVVQWLAAEDSSHTSPADALSLIEAAGFQISSILSPAEALARLAIERRRGSPSHAIAWLVLNTYGAAIAIVRDDDLLFSRTFPIRYKFDLPTSKAELLQRYLLISHVAPELSRGFAVVREVHGVSVGLVVTCGDLPDLRSLTMPLIEELDIEVETLDSTEGLQATARVSASHVATLAPALRLATAAAIEGGIRSGGARPTLAVVARLAAAAAVVAALAWVGYSYWRAPKPNPVASSAGRTPDPASRIPDRGLRQAQAVPSSSRDASRSAAGSRPAESIEGRAPEPPTAPESVPQPVATGGSRKPNRAVPVMPDAPPEQSLPASSDKKTALQTGSAAPRLPEPLPRIDTVLIDQDRRLAIANGVVVSVGDTIGSRVVIDIARDGIALREPSGRVVRVRP